MVAVLAIGCIKQYGAFLADPTTPYATELAGKPYMQSGLCHVRRDLLAFAEGRPAIQTIRENGQFQRVVVR